jgi:hypothetical protein
MNQETRIMKQSLASQTPGALSSDLKLPAIFGAPSPPIEPRHVPPYVVFVHHNRADEWSKVTSRYKDVTEGDLFLVRNGDVRPLNPAKFGWLCHRQFWVQSNPAGDMVATSFAELPFPYKESVEAVVLVYLDDEVFPANVTFRTTKCPAAHELARAMLNCQTPEWGANSLAHKESMAVNQPFGRFYGEVVLGPQRVGKQSGMTYRPTLCRVFPTGAAEWRALHALSQNSGFTRMMEDAASRFTERLAGVEAKLLKK